MILSSGELKNVSKPEEIKVKTDAAAWSVSLVSQDGGPRAPGAPGAGRPGPRASGLGRSMSRSGPREMRLGVKCVIFRVFIELSHQREISKIHQVVNY